MKTIKGILAWLIGSKFGWCILGFIFAAIFLISSNYVENEIFYNVLYYAGMSCIGFVAVMTLIFIAYAWVINPIREYKENKKNKLLF
jgi:uncharacterized membrane protein